MKWLLVKIPLAFLLLFLLGYVMQCFWVGGIPTHGFVREQDPYIAPSWTRMGIVFNFYLAHAGSGVGILLPGLAVAVVVRLALRKHQTAAPRILVGVAFFIGLLAKSGDLHQQGAWPDGIGHAFLCGFGYAMVMGTFWLGVEGLWRIDKETKADESKWALKADRAKRALEESRKDS